MNRDKIFVKPSKKRQRVRPDQLHLLRQATTVEAALRLAEKGREDEAVQLLGGLAEPS
jgi:hypothetical protein